MKKSLIKIAAGKKLKRKIINKAKFSNKLGSLLLEPLNEYKIKGSDENIIPTLFSNEKFAININFSSKNEELNHMLENFLFKFDLYAPANIKKNIRNAYFLDEFYNSNIMEHKDKLANYDYVINIENEDALLVFKNGFIEACLSLLHKNNDYIYLGTKTNQNKVDKSTYYQLVELSEKEPIATLEKCLSDNISIDCSIFSTKILTSSRLEKIKKVDISNAKSIQLVYKYLKNISNNVIFFENEFKYEKKQRENSYFEISYKELLNELLKYETITFDIFDTLVTRTVLVPDDIFHLVEKSCKIKMPESFISIRKKAEQEAINTLQKDVSLDEIYNAMKNMKVLKEKDVEALKKLEIEYELKHIIPRDDMIKIYNELLKHNKNIDIISDMYLPEKIIIKILEKCKIKNYRKLYVSNELNMRKDTGFLWDMYYKNNKEKTIHIGDNYNSDYIQVLKRKRSAIKILSSYEYLVCDNIKEEKNIDIRNELALLYNQRLFNSPFVRLNDFENNLKVYGEQLLSSIFYTFFDWFNNVKKIKKILFISREGYYLQQIYEKYCKIFNQKKIDSIYFLTSRRAVTIACCKNQKDILELAKIDYNGTLTAFFKNRYGVIISSDKERIISLPRDYDIVEKIIINNEKTILENAQKERDEYINYIKSVCSKFKDDEYGIIDLGYSGTTQYYLSKLLNVKISGYYFAITNKKTPEKLGCEVKGCFNEDNNGVVDEENSFCRMALYLESFLSAPEGQLIKFENNNPVYKNGDYNKKRKKELDLIYEGVISGLEMFKEQRIKPFDIKTMNHHYNLICELLKNCGGNLEKILYLDDDYCRDGKELVKINKVFNDE